MKVRIRVWDWIGYEAFWPWCVRLTVMLEHWRGEIRTPRWLPLQILVTLRRWVE
jgi:hypothetical protein